MNFQIFVMKIGSFSTIKNPKYYELCKGNQNTHLKSSDFEIKMDWDIFQIHIILIILILLFFWICQSFFTKLWKKNSTKFLFGLCLWSSSYFCLMHKHFSIIINMVNWPFSGYFKEKSTSTWLLIFILQFGIYLP